MTEAELALRIHKMKRRAPKITSQSHVEKIVGSFPVEHRPLVISELGAMLPERLEAREPAVIEVKPQIEGQPNATEQTVMRLNAQAAKIVEQSDTMAEMSKTIREQETTIKNLQERLGKAAGRVVPGQ